MPLLKLFVALGALTAASNTLAWDYVLLDTDKAAQNWQITSQQLGVKPTSPSALPCAPCTAVGKRVSASSTSITVR